MFNVPRYTATNYRQIILQPYDDMQSLERINFNKILQFLTEANINSNASLDARRIWVNYQQELVQTKLLLPTLRTCDYFMRNIGKWTHHGIDILLPKNTPIVSFDSWVVTKIKKRDGKKKDEWNCVVIKWPTCYWSYEHCEKINVKVWDFIKRWQKIATVWNTWNSTQYHLHLQCDKFNSPFQPYYNADWDIWTIQKYTLDPLEELKKILPHTWLYYDMPLNAKYRDAIVNLTELWIIKWHKKYINPFGFSQRYEFALIIYRLLQKKIKLTKWLSEIQTQSMNYKDISSLDQESKEALMVLRRYWIMKWFNDKFEPYKNIKWQEILAVFWRLFWKLSDQKVWHWYNTYVKKFEQKNIIPSDWEFIWLPIIRQELFRILWALLEDN